VADQAEMIFRGIRDVLRETGAQILDERLFATAGAIEIVERSRKETYGDFDDRVPPTCLIVPKGVVGEFGGVQVHAVRSKEKVGVLEVKGSKCGRVLRRDGHVFVVGCGLTARVGSGPTGQAQGIFEKAEAMLEQVGGDMHSVVRTWLWLDDVLKWYDNFNCVRTDFFMKRGLIDRASGTARLPASTGIGIAPGGRARCALSLVAVVEPRDAAEFLLAGGKQGSAYEYGSAFSRASRAVTPGGETVFVSGTASVDIYGATEHREDPTAQIAATIANVQAVLKEMSCSDDDVVQAVAYCKTQEVEKAFRAMQDGPSWPYVTVIAEVCRQNLFFEIEVTASRGARRVR